MSIFLSIVQFYGDQSNLIGYCFCSCTFVSDSVFLAKNF